MNDEVKTKRRIHKRSYSIVLVVLFTLLCLLGLFTVVKYGVGLVNRVLDKTSQKQQYEQMLMPLVMFDTVTFEDPATLDNTTLLQSSIWSILLGENRDYAYDEARNIVIPASDVDVAGHKLFGPGVALTHESFGDYTVNYYYDADIKSYRIPLAAVSGYYTPQVERVTSSGEDVLELEVGYIPPASALNYSVTGNESANETPSKYMQYELRRSADTGEYYVYALRLISSQMVGSDEVYTPDYFSGSSYSVDEPVLDSGSTDYSTEIDPNIAAGSSQSQPADSAGDGMIVNEDGELVQAENPADYPTLEG